MEYQPGSEEDLDRVSLKDTLGSAWYAAGVTSI
jgi:hypothetical protein